MASGVQLTYLQQPRTIHKPGTYILVFNGDMGNEKADPSNSVVGAVVGKVLAPAVGFVTTDGVILDFDGKQLSVPGVGALAVDKANIFAADQSVHSKSGGLVAGPISITDFQGIVCDDVGGSGFIVLTG